jgi:hypothetical protein
MTPAERNALEAQIENLTSWREYAERNPHFDFGTVSQIEAALAELQAKLDAADSEPDWEEASEAIRDAAARALGYANWRAARWPGNGDPNNLRFASEKLKAQLRTAVYAISRFEAKTRATLSLAPRPVVDEACSKSAEEFADYLAQFYDQRAGAWRSKIIRAIIHRDRTLSHAPAPRRPSEAELREMALKVACPLMENRGGATFYQEAALEMARRIFAYQDGGAA